MFYMLIVCLITAAITTRFILWELWESMDNFDKLTTIQKFMPWNILVSFTPVLVDIGITLIIVAIFSIGGGIIGTAISMTISSIISGSLYFRRKKKNQVVC